MISDKTHKLFEEIAEYIIKLYKRAEKAEAECKTLSDILAKDTMDALGAIRRAKKAEAMVERMINEVAKMEKGFELYIKTIGNGAVGIENFTEDWNALVAEWKERE